MKTVIFDADAVSFPASFAPNAARSAINKIYRTANHLGADRFIIAFGSPGTTSFRRAMFPDYKKARELKPKPPEVEQAIDALWAEFDGKNGGLCRHLPTCEADDVVGVLSTSGTIKGEVVIASSDKDMLSIPGLHHHIAKDKPGVTTLVDGVSAYRNHIFQTIVGDVGDGYGGAKGIGPAGTLKILAHPPDRWWPLTEAAFLSRSQTKEDALLQARLARILHRCDYDLEARAVIPWTPEKSERLWKTA